MEGLLSTGLPRLVLCDIGSWEVIPPLYDSSSLIKTSSSLAFTLIGLAKIGQGGKCSQSFIWCEIGSLEVTPSLA